MQQTHFLQKLYDKYYPQKSNSILNIDWENLTLEEKKKLSETYLIEGEQLLIKKDLSAIEYFNAATKLNPESYDLWFRQGKAFLNYGKMKKHQKALYLANKNFKIASDLNENNFEIWWCWAKSLTLLASKTGTVQYLQDAKEKYQKAISLMKTNDKENKAQIYWEFANLWIEIAVQSQEAGDVRMAIQSFRLAFAHLSKISAEFWHDFGRAFLQMGLFINDNRLYVEAIQYFNKALKISKNPLNILISIAEAYTELYINTVDENSFKGANEAFLEIVKLSSDSDVYLQWAQLLCEAGKLSKDSKKLRLAVEKCEIASNLNRRDPFIVGQWVEALSLLGAYSNNLDLIIDAEKKIIKETKKNQKAAELWFAYGVCLNSFSIYYNDCEYDELAIEKYQMGLSLDRTNSELWHALALTYGKIGSSNEDIDYLKRSMKFFLKAIDLKPSCPTLCFDYGNLLLQLGEITENQKLLEEALFYIEHTLNQHSFLHHPDWLFAYGRVLDLLGDCQDEENSFYKRALKAFQNVMLIDPDYPRLHYHIGLTYAYLGEISFETNYFKLAINSFKQALKRNEEDDLSYLELGIAYISLAEQEENPTHYIEAEKYILKSGQLGNEQSTYHLACLYSILNRFEESINFLIKADKLQVLPSIDELLDDDWLENVRQTQAFTSFLEMIENKQNMVDGH